MGTVYTLVKHCIYKQKTDKKTPSKSHGLSNKKYCRYYYNSIGTHYYFLCWKELILQVNNSAYALFFWLSTSNGVITIRLFAF